MRILVATLFIAVTVSAAIKNKNNVVSKNCELGKGFDCSKRNIKRCKTSSNMRSIRQHCNAMSQHDDLMKELQSIFEEEIVSRKPRMLEPLEEGYVSQSSFDEAGSCKIGGGTVTTFDGYSHALTVGPCTYALAVDRNISRLVVYGVYESFKEGQYANKLTDVALYIDHTSLVLGRDFDINYKGLGYDAPARINDKLVVWQDEHYIYAEAAEYGVLVRWDPAGQLRIAVDSSFLNQTLGLCGMFNGDKTAGGEHNSLKQNYGDPDMSSHEFGKAWALAGCFNEDPQKISARQRNCDRGLLKRLCSVSHAAPQLAECLRDGAYGRRFRKECVETLCLCDDIDACLYSETLRISNDCYDRLGQKIANSDLRDYLDGDFIQDSLPADRYHEETDTEKEDEREDTGQPFSYRAFQPSGSCYVYGHSHVTTFDGVNYRTDAHACTYPLAVEKGIQDFAIYGTFSAEKPTGQLAPQLSYISFFDIKHRVRVQLGTGREVNYEGRAVSLPYHREFVSIWNWGGFVYIYDQQLGVEVRWDGESVLRIRLEGRYHDKTKGLCGTFNGNDQDEINVLKKTSLIAATYQVMVQEWKLPSCGFNMELYADPAQCVPSQEDKEACRAALTSVKFSFCVTDLPPIHFIERCEKDLCRCEDKDGCKCDIVSAYAQMCQDLGIDISWRTDDFCPLNMCLFGNNGCKQRCSPPGICSCEPGFKLGADGRSCVLDFF